MSRPNDVKLKERMRHVDDAWAELESSLESTERHLTATQTLLLPSFQAAGELEAWMDGIKQTVNSHSSLQPKTADDVQQLHNKFKV